MSTTVEYTYFPNAISAYLVGLITLYVTHCNISEISLPCILKCNPEEHYALGCDTM
jgi:hypothetical protein